MRDPSRIRPLLDRLTTIWEKYPDLRLGQLILGVPREPSVIYNMEDGKLLKEIEDTHKAP